ncbi:MAG: transcription antitermination factor NusB [Candidatus Lambdaproteobacteria bacterium RIFOXYD1_FULL_56_27]|uniref:Transcription antitermination protein NusB n=1 Tax=Candidatus Lambdaproteobacteria bacterium RIFOXYD2_FULL_56_26 TaxID=1817773 RepID=A0A1F6H326_9PROT|nr:MAG: transcription antitermination factor NusB [Candidatus Lambdaproteobacteria bacterium RIFOXYD2_FULL_56_26]OGH05386.1 MAG: transcription antitermination factor NusB [Candidatus Lambdaproteobacteria bacterium RIFOXYC1_FULL_56_13]OGH09230.1 MAG: transcription antitermination factor NusB [Candidatus Lambdaproteobacteria bacterium RIFOXYD1_FULL_56_27]
MPQLDRRQARTLAFLCQYQRQRLPGIAPAEEMLMSSTRIKPKNLEFAQNLLATVLSRQEEIDRLIQKHSSNWKQSRLLEPLNALLRVSIAELLAVEEVDDKVVFNEAIEICRAYVGEKSIKLLNGILHAVSQEVRSD